MFGDLEAPGALLAAAASVARRVERCATVPDAAGNAAPPCRGELVMMATGPDATSIAMTNNSLVSMAALGLRKHVMLLTDSWTTCEILSRPPGPCFWSSRMLRTRPADSITLQRFWDYRFRFYYIKKRYMAQLVAGGYAVLQADTDTVWLHDPFLMLRQMGSSIISMRDVGLANAGVVYARPGSGAAHRLLEEVAWRIQLFQNFPEIVGRIVPFARPPYYANSDDQTLLNDAILSAVIRNRTFVGSTARYEARNKYNPTAPEWSKQPEAALERAQMRTLWRSQSHGVTTIPWDANGARRIRYTTLPIGEGDSVAFAPRALFAHLPFTPTSAIIHLTAARGFGAKVAALRRIGRWDPQGSQEDRDVPPAGSDQGGSSSSAGGREGGAGSKHSRGAAGRAVVYGSGGGGHHVAKALSRREGEMGAAGKAVKAGGSRMGRAKGGGGGSSGFVGSHLKAALRGAHAAPREGTRSRNEAASSDAGTPPTREGDGVEIRLPTTAP